jgi:hypothetical protein
MNDYIEIIKNQFFSTDNIDFIIKVANSKNISIISNQITFNACNNIYNQFIHTVYTQKKTIKPETIEELLITLNKMVIDLIIDDYKNKPPYENETIDSFNKNVIGTSDTVKNNINDTSDTSDTSDTVSEIGMNLVNTIPIDTTTNQVLIDIMTNTKTNATSTTRESLYLFSEDSLFKDGEYTFEFRRKNIKNLHLESLEILNNLYNVTENNNTIEISEKNNKKIVNIPVGCYKLEDLIQCLETSIMDKCKSNNIKVTHDTYKNQISIKGDGPFSMNFIENENLFIPLRFIMGFDKKNYMNNDIYLTSQHPVCNIHDNIYIKITTKEYSDIFNTKWCKDFNFYDTISFKQLDTFGDDVRINISNNNISNTSIDIDDISLELYYRHIHHRKFYKINQRLKFLMIFNIDKIM